MRTLLTASLALLCIAVAAPVSAQQQPASIGTAQGEELARATGHYARARSLLIAAINEFDKGLKVARPDALLDPEQWRSTLVSRIEDMERLLDPQPRATRTGVTYSPDTRLLSDTKK
jgi:hypothetical protein